MRRVVLVIGLLAMVSMACSFDLDFGDGAAPDPRLGEQGLIRFVGGGCSAGSSTVMAVGARQTLRMEAAGGGVLPGQLSVSASEPETIEAQIGAAPDEVDLVAHRVGSSRVQVLAAGTPYDAIGLSAAVALTARHEVALRVFVGGTIDVVVDEVHGLCHTASCPLLGHGFMSWRSEPAGPLALLLDLERTTSFHAGEVAAVEVIGTEVADGRELVRSAIQIVPLEGVTGFAATVTTIPMGDDEEPRTVALPGAIQTNEVFVLQLDALRGEAARVPISRRDISWTVGGDVIGAGEMEWAGSPLGQLFVATASAGQTVLTADVALLDETPSFELTVVE